jgi:hypothetical protein
MITDTAGLTDITGENLPMAAAPPSGVVALPRSGIMLALGL